MRLFELNTNPLQTVSLVVRSTIQAKIGVYQAPIKINGKSVDATVFEPTLLHSGDIIVIDGRRNPVLIRNDAAFKIRVNSVAINFDRLRISLDEDLHSISIIFPFQALLSTGDLAVSDTGLQNAMPHREKKPSTISARLAQSLLDHADMIQCLYSENEWELNQSLAALRKKLQVEPA